MVLLATRRQGGPPASFCIGVSLLVKCDNDKRTEGDISHDDFRPGAAETHSKQGKNSCGGVA